MNDERARRWRLVLGAAAGPALGGAAGAGLAGLSDDDQQLDQVLAALYDADRGAGLAASAPNVARWLGDIRTYFPSSVVRVMQQDAIDRLGLKRLLLEPELLSQVEPDVQLVATLIALASVIPSRTRETARLVVRRVVERLEQRLAEPLRQAVTGALSRGLRNPRPACVRSTGTAPSAPTCATTSRHGAPSSPNAWWATAASGSGSRTSSSPSTRAARWPPPSCTPLSSAR